MAVYVCRDRDIECGDRPANWCAECPKKNTPEQRIAALEARVAVSADYSDLLHRIRVAAGDPKGKLMQDELVARIAALAAGVDSTDELNKLRAFFREVAELTIEHDVEGDSAVVYPSKLGKALEKVDPNWHGWHTPAGVTGRDGEPKPPEATVEKEKP
jgi:hypothetical protein